MNPKAERAASVNATNLVALALLGGVLCIAGCGKKGAERNGEPDPATTGKLVASSNLEGAGIEMALIEPADPRSTVTATGFIEHEKAGLPPGKYAVTARKEGWPDAREEVVIEAGKTTEIAFRFKMGSLRVESDPEGATVLLGKTTVGKTPLVVPQLPAGECALTLEYPAFPPMPVKATVTEGTETTEKVRLPHGKLTVLSTPPGAKVIFGKWSYGQTPLMIERFPAGASKLKLQADDFPPLELDVTVADGAEVSINPELGNGFPMLEPAELFRAVWVADDPNRIAPPLEGVTFSYQPRNGIVKNLDRKKLHHDWMDTRFRYRAPVKGYDKSTGTIEFAEDQCEQTRYRVLAILATDSNASADLADQLARGATIMLYGKLTAAEEPKFLSKVVTLELSEARLLKDGAVPPDAGPKEQ